MPIKLLKDKILPVIFKHVHREECVVFLFGSFAQKQSVQSSDIDIGIICAKPLANLTLLKIKEELEGQTLRDIDLIDFTSASDKEFLKLALRRIKICHQTRKSKVYLANLRKRAKD
ncbi:MAG: nucleotidyltransferase domain-containing protein [Candidatus Omnitrophota bacterium]